MRGTPNTTILFDSPNVFQDFKEWLLTEKQYNSENIINGGTKAELAEYLYTAGMSHLADMSLLTKLPACKDHFEMPQMFVLRYRHLSLR